MNLNELKQKLNVLVDPSNGFTIGETNSIKHVSYDEEKDIVILTIAMGRLGGENEKNFRRSIAKVVKVDCGYKGLQLQLDELLKNQFISLALLVVKVALVRVALRQTLLIEWLKET